MVKRRAINYYHVTVDALAESLEAKRSFVEKFAFTQPDRFWHYLHHLFPKDPFLVCALDMAGWDLYGKLHKQPLYKIWDTHFSETVPLTDYTIGIDTIENMVNKMRRKPWPIYKIKLGVENDIEMVQALRENTSAILRVDANEGWTTEEALQKIPKLHALRVELIEQPLQKENWDGMKVLFGMSPIPLIADESCVTENDVAKCAGFFHGINIKLTKCGGVTPALRMIKNARSLQLKVMMGSMNESSIGSAAIAHCIPQLDYVDADGPLLLTQDLASGLHYADGQVRVSDRAGLGVLITF